MSRRLVLVPVIVVAGCAAGPPPPEPAVRSDINAAYAEPAVEQWVERFEREGREIYDRRHEIVAACRVRTGTAVADVGAGTGLFEPLFADAVGSEGVVYAVDIVPGFLDLIAERAAGRGHRQVRTVLGTERSIELAPASVDLVFTCDTYHHFEHPRAMLASIHRALRPGGALVVVDFERIEGVSSAWILDHVRAGKTVVIAEIESAGFDFVEEVALLDQNYVLRFVRR